VHKRRVGGWKRVEGDWRGCWLERGRSREYLDNIFGATSKSTDGSRVYGSSSHVQLRNNNPVVLLNGISLNFFVYLLPVKFCHTNKFRTRKIRQARAGGH
jgi:hypothetical protein